MTRGKKSEIGDTRTSPNGYHYTKTATGWELTHRLTAQRRLGRELRFDERVRFADGNRSNYTDPDNLDVYKVREPTRAKRKARIETKIDDLQGQLRELEDAD